MAVAIIGTGQVGKLGGSLDRELIRVEMLRLQHGAAVVLGAIGDVECFCD